MTESEEKLEDGMALCHGLHFGAVAGDVCASFAKRWVPDEEPGTWASKPSQARLSLGAGGEPW